MKFVIILVLLVSAGVASAQPNVLWEQTYGGDWEDRAFSVVQNDDAGYAIAGYKTTGQGNDCNIDFWLVRTDASGNEVWAHNFGAAHWDYCYSMIKTSDGGYAMVGITLPAGGGPSDGMVVKTDSDGNEEWSQTYHIENVPVVLYTIAESVNGGFILGGSSHGGNAQMLLIRTDANGAQTWSSQFGGYASTDICKSVIETSNGEIVMAGETTFNQQGGAPHQYVANAAGGLDFWLVMADANGAFLWDRSFGTPDNEHCQAVIQTSDGGFALVGGSVTYAGADTYSYLVKADANGDNPWTQTYDSENPEAGLTLIEHADGGFMLGGVIYPGGNSSIAYLLKTDANGASVWTETFSDGIQNACFSLIPTSDGGYAFAGSKVAQGGGANSDYWLVKLESENPFDGYNDFIETDDNCTLLVTAAHFNNTPVPTGWEIGVFTPGNVLAGGGIWTDGQNLGIAAFGDDNQTQAVEGFVAGETMTFHLWDNTANVVHLATATVSYGSINWSVDGATALSLQSYGEYTMNISLNNNWNLISLNVVPPQQYWTGNQGPDVVTLMSQFSDHLLMVKNERGKFYWAAYNYCNIPFWNLEEGYQVKMDQAMQGSWTGALIPANTNIPIAQGWNMIAYFPTYELSTSAAGGFYALSGIIQNVIIAKDRNGNFLSPGNNYNGIPRWHESAGYQIKVSANVVLNYPVQNDNIQSMPGDSPLSQSGHWTEPVGTGINMSVLVNSIDGLNVQDGDQIAALNTSGNVVGIGTIQDGRCGLAVWGDDISTEVVDGLRNGEAFTLRLWNSSKGAEVALEANAIQGSLIYETDGFTAVSAISATVVPEAFYLSQSFPNPFNSTTRLAFGLPEAAHVAMQVFDMNGRLVATLADADFKAGSHSAVWNADASPAGLYMVKIQAGSHSDVRKLTLVK